MVIKSVESPYKKNRFLIILEIIMLVFCAIMAYPFFMMLSVSFKNEAEVIASPLGLPSVFNFSNYTLAFTQMGYLIALKNTVIMTAVSILTGALLYSMASYAFMRAKRGRKAIGVMYFIMIAGHILPAQAALTPLVFLLKSMNLLNTMQGIICVYIGANAAYGIFLISRFISSVPVSLEESAFIDGCTPFGVFFKIMLPLLKPVIISLIIIKSVDIWNDMIFSLIILQGKNARTLPLAVYFFRGEYSTQWNVLFAALALSILPVVIFFLIMQKHIVTGLTAGAVKS